MMWDYIISTETPDNGDHLLELNLKIVQSGQKGSHHYAVTSDLCRKL